MWPFPYDKVVINDTRIQEKSGHMDVLDNIILHKLFTKCKNININLITKNVLRHYIAVLKLGFMDKNCCKRIQ